MHSNLALHLLGIKCLLESIRVAECHPGRMASSRVFCAVLSPDSSDEPEEQFAHLSDPHHCWAPFSLTLASWHIVKPLCEDSCCKHSLQLEVKRTLWLNVMVWNAGQLAGCIEIFIEVGLWESVTESSGTDSSVPDWAKSIRWEAGTIWAHAPRSASLSSGMYLY